MNLDYFKCQIKDELCGAKHYIRKALEVKPMNPDWATYFVEMSNGELQHAKHLYEMLGQYYSHLSDKYGEEMPSSIQRCYEGIVEMYTDCLDEVKRLHSTY